MTRLLPDVFYANKYQPWLGEKYGDAWDNAQDKEKSAKKEAIGQVSDASLFVLDSNNNPNMEILFRDAFPIALSGLDFDISGGDSPYFTGLASFKYRIFNIKSVT